MITQEHLEHWLSEIEYQLGGMSSKLQSEDRNENHSLEYIQEKRDTIHKLIKTIKWDILNDEAATR